MIFEKQMTLGAPLSTVSPYSLLISNLVEMKVLAKNCWHSSVQGRRQQNIGAIKQTDLLETCFGWLNMKLCESQFPHLPDR